MCVLLLIDVCDVVVVRDVVVACVVVVDVGDVCV